MIRLKQSNWRVTDDLMRERSLTLMKLASIVLFLP